MIRILRKIHGWLGFLVMPWIIMIGLSGLYLNHSKLVNSWLPSNPYDETQFDNWANPQPMDLDAAKSVAVAVFPGDTFKVNRNTKYHDRPVHMFDGESGRVIVAAETGHYWIKTRYTRKTFDPEGRRLETKIYWGSALRAIHRRGWLTSGFGSLLADITAGAMVVFGLSGMFLFLVPRLRRRQNKQEQVMVKRTNVPRPKRIRLKN